MFTVNHSELGKTVLDAAEYMALKAAELFLPMRSTGSHPVGRRRRFKIGMKNKAHFNKHRRPKGHH